MPRFINPARTIIYEMSETELTNSLGRWLDNIPKHTRIFRTLHEKHGFRLLATFTTYAFNKWYVNYSKWMQCRKKYLKWHGKTGAYLSNYQNDYEPTKELMYKKKMEHYFQLMDHYPLNAYCSYSYKGRCMRIATKDTIGV